MKKWTIAFMMLLCSVACTSKKEQSPESVSDTVKTQAKEMYQTAKWSLVEAESNLHWKGFKPGGEHWGTVKMTDSYLLTMNDMPSGGRFTIDMKTISTADLAGEMKDKLESHLTSADFFDVAQYPTSLFTITSTEGSGDNMYPILVHGNLTIKDKTHPVKFKARHRMSNDTIYAETEIFKIDRTDYGVNHMSKNIFKELKDMFINDEIEFQIKAAFVPMK